jgi:murein DD-endopeptidase MepM/ murein hydrolase activator NlpD
MAISSPISLLKSTASQTTKTTKSIQNTLTGGLSRKRNLISSIGLFKNRRRDFDKREIQKNIISNPTILTKSGGARSLSLSDQGLNITDRLFGFVKYLTAGWILGNLPTWISLGEQFAGRLGTAGSILKNYGDETLNVMKSISGIFDSAFKNLSAFDFSDSSGLMENSIGELTKSLDDLGEGLSSALDVLFAPFKNVPEIGEITEEPDAYTDRPQQPPINGKNSDFWTLVAVTALEESDPQGRADVAQSIYNRSAAGVFPGGKNIRNIILAENGGQYQPVERAVKEFHQISDRESAIKAIMVADKVSRKMAEQMIDNTASAINNPTLRKNAAEFIENRTDFRGKNLKVDKPSSTLPRRRTPNDNIFGNFVGPASYAYGQKTSGNPSPVPNFGVTQTPPPQQSPNPTAPTRPSGNFAPVSGTSGVSMGDRPVSISYSPIKPNSGVTITSVMGQRQGREHTGYDLAGNAGTPLYAYFSGVVTHENRVPPRYAGDREHGAGYGYWIIWKDDVYGSYHFFGHMLKPAEVKKGQRFEQGALLGYIGSTGRSTGPHLHWEISNSVPDSNGNFTSREDVKSWLKNHPLKASSSSRQTQTASQPNPPKPSTSLVPSIQQSSASDNVEQSVEMQNNNYNMNLLDGIVQERRGRQIVVIDDRSSTVAQIVSSGGDGGSYIQMSSEYSMLNTFMKNKLLLDLTYL